MASTFVLYRAAFSLGISLQYPVWIACGLLVPLSILPACRRAHRLVPRAVLGLPCDPGGRARRPRRWPAIGMCVVVSAGYLVLGAIVPALFVRVARARGTLRLT